MEMAQVGVKTRARTALAMGATKSAPTPKRRKINNSNRGRKISTAKSEIAASATVVKTKTKPTLSEPVTEKRVRSPTSDEFQASCCSSNGSDGEDEDRIKLLDLEVESAQVEMSTCNFGEGIERREMSNSSEIPENSHELDSLETNSHRSLSSEKIMPTDLELEEFFADAEKNIQKRFQDKYNYDIVKDVPLEGRYEWVQTKP